MKVASFPLWVFYDFGLKSSVKGVVCEVRLSNKGDVRKIFINMKEEEKIIFEGSK